MRRRSAIAAGLAVVALVVALLGLWLLPAADPPRGSGDPPSKGRRAGRDRSPAERPASPGPADPAVAPDAEPGPATLAPDAAPKEPRVVVAGRVVGPGDQPVAGASVSLFRGEGLATAPEGSLAEILSDRLRIPRPSTSALTDEDGAFRFTITPAVVGTLLAEKEGWTAARVGRTSLLADAEGVLLRLAGPTPVTGTVVRKEGEARVPVAGATAMLYRAGAAEGESSLVVLARSETAEDGSFSLAGARPGAANLVILAKGMKPYLQERVDVPSDVRTILLTPAAFRFLRGAVRLPDGTTPAPDVTVTVRTRPRDRPAEALQSMRTDADGRFAFEEVEWGEVCSLDIVFEGGKRGYAALSRTPWPGDSDEPVVLEAPPAETLRGVVLGEGPGGRGPVAGLRLRASFLWECRAGKLPREVFDVTAKDGSFEFRGVRDREVAVNPVDPRGDWVVNVPNRGLVPWKPAEGPWEVEILLAHDPRTARFGEVSVAGRVVGTGGVAVAGARVFGFGDPGYTDREGRFLLRGLVPISGTQIGMMVRIRAAAEGYQATAGEDVFLLPGSDPTGMLISFSGTLLAVRGRVVDGEGRPVSGARVELPRIGIVWTAPDGWWRAEGIPGTVSKATISSPGYVPVVIPEVQTGDTVETAVLLRR